MVKNKCTRTRPIGANPRRYFCFRSEKGVKRHIKRETPELGKCIGKIKKLKTREMKCERGGRDYLVYFTIPKR